jgi:hypothetical protein
VPKVLAGTEGGLLFEGQPLNKLGVVHAKGVSYSQLIEFRVYQSLYGQ